MAQPRFRSSRSPKSSRAKNKKVRAHKVSRHSQIKPEYFHEAIGSIPGTLTIHPESAPPEIVLLDYSEDQCERRLDIKPIEIKPYLDHKSVTWIDLKGFGHEETIRQIGDVFQLHPLFLEDIVNVPQRPKVEEAEHQLLMIACMVGLGKPSEQLDNGDDLGNRDDLSPTFMMEQVSFVLGAHYVLTVQEEPDYDCFDTVRDRLRNGRGTIRQRGADYLMYALLDSIIDGFFPVLEAYGEALELLEDEVVANPTIHTLERIHRMKRDLIRLRRAIWPQRDAINSLIRDGNPLIGEDIRIHLRDCYDHTVQVMDMVETYREVASSLMDVYLSSVSNRMNEIMKFLTVISSIFIPLTFIAGIYGMNFNTEKSRTNMPELNQPYGYLICLVVMGIIAIGMVFFFWKKGWFENYAMQPRRSDRH
jgi:magnesium transporter